MRFSFETPLAMLSDSLAYNDYDYALVHLFDQSEEYLKFFERNILVREMYLDNSAYELGESFDPVKFAEYVKKFDDLNGKNLRYFLPDYPGDPVKTLEAAKSFPRGSFKAKSIGVVHGSGFMESLQAAVDLGPHCDMLAIPMLKEDYDQSHKQYTGLVGRTDARIRLVVMIRHLQDAGVIANRPLHLLGCLLPQEFKNYPKGMVYSADTSNPVVHGYEGIKYGIHGLSGKSDLKLHEIMDREISPTQRKNILDNIEAFYSLNLGYDGGIKDKLQGVKCQPN